MFPYTQDPSASLKKEVKDIAASSVFVFSCVIVRTNLSYLSVLSALLYIFFICFVQIYHCFKQRGKSGSCHLSKTGKSETGKMAKQLGILLLKNEDPNSGLRGERQVDPGKQEISSSMRKPDSRQ